VVLAGLVGAALPPVDRGVAAVLIATLPLAVALVLACGGTRCVAGLARIRRGGAHPGQRAESDADRDRRCAQGCLEGHVVDSVFVREARVRPTYR
jgi:hypothetical protein